MRRIDVPVLIVGAGPVGLTASLLLSRYGLAHRVVDRRSGPHRAPQAHVVNPRSLEIFRQLGLDTARLRRMATPRVDGGHVSWCATLAGDELGRRPYERQDDAVLALTPEPIVNLSQHLLEPVLLEAADESAVGWGHEWCALEQDENGVTSRVRDLAGGDDYEIRSRWVLATDGAGSPVRKALGIPMLGPDRLQSFVMIHFEANLRALVRNRPAILYWVMDPEWMGSFVAHDIDRTWVFMRPFDSETDPIESYDQARCTAIVRGAVGRDDVDLAVRNVSAWHMASQIAGAYRAGRVLLAGDSAHRFPPAGGMGMNTGIQDVHNLVWKLRLVDDGNAEPRLLDTYESERLPVAQRNADQSLVNAMRLLATIGELGLGDDVATSRARLHALVTTEDGRERIRGVIEARRDHFDMLGLQLGFAYETGAIVADGSEPPVVANPVSDFVPTARPGSRMPHAWIERGGGRCSSLDLIPCDGFTLLAGPDGERWIEAAKRAAIRIVVAGRDFCDPDDAWRRACGIDRDGSLLVRPDQHVAWRATTSPANAEAALATALVALA